jgi:hypothetical protein
MMKKKIPIFLISAIALTGIFYYVSPFLGSHASYVKDDKKDSKGQTVEVPKKIEKIKIPPLDKAAYDKKLIEIANNPPPSIVYKTITEKGPDGKLIKKKVPLDPQPTPPPNLWPIKTVYPKGGALLPFNRIIAYYGNLFSTKMGALGAWPEEEMLTRLRAEAKKWQDADPATPVIPALHYIVVTAQGSPGKDGKYRLRMPFTEVDKVLKMAEKINGIVFLDVQVGFSTLQIEVPLLEKYLKMPNVHLGIDAEFSMKGDKRPGKVVGTLDAADINFVANYLAKLVKENNLPPKVLVVHRYTEKMITNYKNITPLPEVQIVMHMDGWGGKAKKLNTYQQFIVNQPVQFTGFKLFYKNDVFDPGTTMFEPKELLKISPIPLYIQYQ